MDLDTHPNEKVPGRIARSGRKRILVAGGAGFLGFHLCEALLDRGHEVLCVDNLQTGSAANLRDLSRRGRISFIQEDICNPLDGPKVDQIFNLACPASPPLYRADPVHTMLTNVVGTNNLLALAEQQGARLLQASTSEIYGDPEQHPQREAYLGHVNPIGPRACYDEGKRAAEALCFDYLRHGRVDARVVRIFNTYGPRMRPDDGRIVSNFIRQALTGEALTVFGTGEQTRSFCYVTDMVRGMIALMDLPANPFVPVNLGNPNERSIRDMAAKILLLTGSKSKLVYRPLPTDDPRRRQPDIGRAKELLNWQPEVDLEDGLMPTIEWLRGACSTSATPAFLPERALPGATKRASFEGGLNAEEASHGGAGLASL